MSMLDDESYNSETFAVQDARWPADRGADQWLKRDDGVFTNGVGHGADWAAHGTGLEPDARVITGLQGFKQNRRATA